MMMPTFVRANDSTKTKADGMYVSAEYIAQCDKNLKRAKSFKKETAACEALRNTDKGQLVAKDRTIKQLTKAGEAKDKKIAHLESRWSKVRLIGIGVAVGSCTVFAVSMFGEADGWTRLVSGAGCVVGVGLTWKW